MRALGCLTMVVIVGFIALVLLARAAFGAEQIAGSKIPALWNQFCASVEHENETLHALNESLHTLRPERVTDVRRLDLYTEAIVEHERQVTLLKRMRQAEFGQAIDDVNNTNSSRHR